MTEHSPTYLTVGHSNHEMADFLAILREAGVDCIVDVRRLPGSKKYPWFDQENLAPSLREAGIGYVHVPALTGRRPKQPDVPDDVNAFWENRSFHNYADYALSDEFARGLQELRSTEAERPALMCSEAVWWRCHRRIIADHLLSNGESVEHIMGPGSIKPASLTPGALVRDGRVSYPAAAQAN